MFYFSFVLLLADPTPAAGRIFWHKKLHFRMVSWPGNHFLGRGLKSLYREPNCSKKFFNALQIKWEKTQFIHMYMVISVF